MVDAELEAVGEHGLQHVSELAGGERRGGHVCGINFGIEVEAVFESPGNGSPRMGLEGEIVCNHDEGKERSIDEVAAVDVAALLFLLPERSHAA